MKEFDPVTSTFSQLGLIEPLQRALNAENYVTPTPIQLQAIPQLLAGRDVLGVAQTGTGKTAAFALPILQRLAATRGAAQPKSPRALVLTPTRELALQIDESFRSYGRFLHLRQAVIFGGVGQQPQVAAMARGVDILVATPGRLLDLMNQRHVRFDGLGFLVLDEADRMLDMGFIRDVRRIVAALPKERQTLFFSATMPGDIAALASSVLRSPVKVEVTPVSSTVERIDQRVLFVEGGSKRALLAEVLRDPEIARVLVFARTKHGADRIANDLARGRVEAAAIHGNKSQNARQRALESFRDGRVRVLVATDIAARGIDIDGITHVINFDLPNVPESYVHRIGRTARAGSSGVALSFCSAEERPLLRDIERLTRRPLSVVADHPFADRAPSAAAAPQRNRTAPPQSRRRRRGRPSPHRHGGAPAQRAQA
ncbi:MAG TPA: DEAD/DEAH box helicase [Stellaceae bacterium]|nr:DEAD/DEAH box helicase [Stellaceae bacterium]